MSLRCNVNQVWIVNVPWSDEDEGYKGVEDTGEDEGNHVEQDDVGEEQKVVVDRGPRHPEPALLDLNIRAQVLYRGKVVIGFRLDPHRDVIRNLSNPSWDNMRVGAAQIGFINSRQ